MNRAILEFLIIGLFVPGVLSAQSDSVEIWMRAFIPNVANAGQADGYIVTVPSDVGSVVRLRNKDGTKANLCFATDNRGFSSASSSSARSETTFVIQPTSAGAASVTPGQNRTRAAITKKVDCANGSVLSQGAGKIVRDHLGNPAVADGTIQVLGQVEAKNVLTPLGDAGPAIDYSFDVKWKPKTGSLKIAFTYGAFPAFEIYARRPGGAWLKVMQRAPTGLPWQLGGDAFGVNTEREELSVTIP